MTTMDDENKRAAELLEALTDKARVRTAEQEVVQLLRRSRAFVAAMFHQLRSNPSVTSRQMAASVLLTRARRTKPASLAAVDTTDDVRDLLFERLTKESSNLVVTRLADLLAALAYKCWPKWQAYIGEFLQRDNGFSTMCVASSVLMNEKLLLKLQSSDMNSVSSAVARSLRKPPTTPECAQAVKAVSLLMYEVDSPSDAERVRALLPLVAAAAHASVAQPEADDTLGSAIDVFVDALGSEEIMQHAQMPEVLSFVVQVVANGDLPEGVRSSGISFTAALAMAYPPKILMQEADLLLRVLVPVILQEDSGLEVGVDANEDASLGVQALDVLERLSQRLSSQRFFPKVVASIRPAMASDDVLAQRGAIRILGAIAEGCAEAMLASLTDLVAPVLEAMRSPRLELREAGTVALADLAAALQPNIARMHEPILSTLLDVLQRPDNQKATVLALCTAVDAYCDQLGSAELSPWLSKLISTLSTILLQSNDVALRSKSLGALASVAAAAGDELLGPYLPQLQEVLVQAVNAKSADMVELRTQAIFNTGYLIAALSLAQTASLREATWPVVMEILKQPFEVNKNNCLREACFGYLSHFVESLRDEAAALVDPMMEVALVSLTQAHGVSVKHDVAEHEDEEPDDEEVRVNRHYTGEAEAAMQLLADLYRCISGDRLNHWLRKVLDLLPNCPAAKTLHDVQRGSIPVYKNIILNAHHALLPSWALRADSASLAAADPKLQAELNSPEGLTLLTSYERRGWTPGVPTQCRLDPSVEALWQTHVWPEMYKFLQVDMPKDIIAEACEALAEIMYVMGPHVVVGGANGQLLVRPLLEWAHGIFSRELRPDAVGEDEDNEDWMAEETLMFMAVAEVVSAIAAVTGPQFRECFPAISEPLMQMAGGKFSLPYRCVGIGCMADILRQINPQDGAAVAKSLLEHALHGIAHHLSTLKQNAAYAFSICCQILKGDLSEVAGKLSTAILDALRENEEENSVRDNLISALGSLIREVPGVNLGALVPEFMNRLPLTEDLDESENVVKTLLWMQTVPDAVKLLETMQLKWLQSLAREAVQAQDLISFNTRMAARNTLTDACKALGKDNEMVQEITKDAKVRKFLGGF